MVSRLKQQIVLGIFMVSHLLCGVGLILIPSLLSTTFVLKVNGDLSDSHIFVLRAVGICCLSLAVIIYLNYNSPDAYTRVSIFFGMLSIALLLLFTNILTLGSLEKSKESKGVTFEHKSLWVYKAIAFAAVNVGSILMAKDFCGHSQLYSRLNLHLKVDFLVSLVFGTLLIAYPTVLLGHLTNSKVSSSDEVLILMMQAIGAYSVGSGVISLLYASVLFTVNKRHIMMSKVLGTLGMILLILFTNFYTKALGGCVQATLLMYALMSFNALLGYYSPHETDGYVSKDK